MNNSSRGRGFVASSDRPSSGFLLSGGEVGPKAEEVVDAFDEGRDSRVCDAHVSEELLRFFGSEVDELFLDASRDDDGFGSVSFGGVILHLFDERVTLWVGGRFAEFVFGDVAGKDGSFTGEQGEFASQEVALVVG